jgi:hypothetical protein
LPTGKQSGNAVHLYLNKRPWQAKRLKIGPDSIATMLTRLSYPITKLTLLMTTLHTTYEIERKRRSIAMQTNTQLVHVELLLTREEALSVLAVAQEITSRRNAA